MDTTLVPQLLIYGALLLGAATLGYWPELRRFTHSLRDLMVVGKVRSYLAHRRQRHAGELL